MELALQCGLRLEDHVREYTSLFDAAQNGRVKLVNILLKYGSNITGEFYFNQETPVSIAAFCLSRSIVETYTKHMEEEFAVELTEVRSDLICTHPTYSACVHDVISLYNRSILRVRKVGLRKCVGRDE